MAERVVLHVGLMKSGTSYLQRRLFAGQEALAEAGVHVPGRGWREQVRAVCDALGRSHPPDAAGKWAWFLDEVAGASGTVALSMEFLGTAPPPKIERVLDDLAPVPVEVVVTLRDLGRNVPAMWQETVKNGSVVSWSDYSGGLRSNESWAKAFWRQQGMGRIVDNWVAALGPDAVTMVTVPQPGADPELLWQRFCEAARIHGAHVPPDDTANTSLDAAAARILCDLNASLDGQLDRKSYSRVVKHDLAKRRLQERRGPDAPGIGYAPPPWLRRRTDQIRERLRSSGARLVGDLGELDPLVTEGVDPGTLEEATITAAAVDALRRMVLLRAEELSGGPS